MQGLFFDGTLQFRRDLLKPKRVEGEALIRVLMAGICQTDFEITRGYMEFRGIPGHEFVGTVEEADDPSLVGKRVVGEINCACGVCSYCRKGLVNHCPQRTVLGIAGRNGALAEFLTLPQQNLHIVPDLVSNEEAVFVEPLASCYRIAEQITIETEHAVAVLGDGRIGLLCAQVLHTMPCRVTLIGKHAEKLALVAGSGIATQMLSDNMQQKFDIVVDCTGSPSGLATALQLINPQGIIVIKTTTAQQRAIDFNALVIHEMRIQGSRCGPFPPAIHALHKKKVNVTGLISAIVPFSHAIEAFHAASQKGIVKILLNMEI